MNIHFLLNKTLAVKFIITSIHILKFKKAIFIWTSYVTRNLNASSFSCTLMSLVSFRSYSFQTNFLFTFKIVKWEV